MNFYLDSASPATTTTTPATTTTTPAPPPPGKNKVGQIIKTQGSIHVLFCTYLIEIFKISL